MNRFMYVTHKFIDPYDLNNVRVKTDCQIYSWKRINFLTMSFAREVFFQSEVTPESITKYLSLPRPEYGQALYDWYKQTSAIEDNNPHLDERSILTFLSQGTKETGIISRYLMGTYTNRKVYHLLDEMLGRGLIKYHFVGHKKLWSINQIRPIVVPVGTKFLQQESPSRH